MCRDFEDVADVDDSCGLNELDCVTIPRTALIASFHPEAICPNPSLDLPTV